MTDEGVDPGSPPSGEEPLAEGDPEAVTEAELGSDEVVRGAVRGSVLLMVRTLGGQLIGFLAMIGIARLIAPSVFGQFAIALAIQQAGQGVIYLGLPAALVQQSAPPSREQQRAVSGFAFTLASGIAGITMACAFGVLPLLGAQSTTAEVIAIACSSLPVLAVRVLPMTLLRRNMRFERLVVVELTAQIVFHVSALTAAFVGFGAYGLAAAVPISALASSIVVSRLQPWERGFSLDLRIIRELAGFGMRVAAFRAVALIQEVGLITLFAVFGSQALAGFYGMSRRILALPYAAARSVQVVGFPALSRLKGEDMRAGQTAKAMVVSATAVGILFAVIVGAAEPLISTLFGTRWLPTVEIIALSAVGLMLFVSVGGQITSYALAQGDPMSPLRAVLVQIVVTVALTAVLVPSLGPVGAGIAVGSGYVVFSAVLLVRRGPAQVRASASPVLRALVIAAVAAAAGYALPLDHGIAALVTTAAASALTWLALSLAIARTELMQLATLLRTHLGRIQQSGSTSTAADRA